MVALVALASAALAADFHQAHVLTEGGADGPVDVVFLVTGGDKSRVDNAHRLAKHLQRPGEPRISFHLVSDKAWPEAEGWATPHLLSSMPAEALALHANFTKLTHGPGSIYMWKPLLAWLLPVPRAMVLDADLVLVRSVHELWEQFGAFESTAAIGLAREQAPSYEHLGPTAGVNGGVQLLHLERMRARDGAYQRELRRCATGACGDIGYLGDQTLYSIMNARTPELFHTLPCGWNRQLSVHFYSHKAFREHHACAPPSCGLVHGNQPAFKGMMPKMQSEGRAPTCAECEQGVAHLQTGQDKALQHSADTLLKCCCAGHGIEQESVGAR